MEYVQWRPDGVKYHHWEELLCFFEVGTFSSDSSPSPASSRSGTTPGTACHGISSSTVIVVTAVFGRFTIEALKRFGLLTAAFVFGRGPT